MARGNSVSDQEMEDAHTKKQPKHQDDQSNDEDGEEEEEEYEIEKILDAKHGMFADGRIGYLVKWKGYDHEQNSWVDEQDAGNATELIEDYWRRNKNNKKAGRKSEPAAKPKSTPISAAKTRKDVSSDAEDAPAQKKRGRPPKAKSTEVSDDDMEEPKSKKPKPSQTAKNGRKPKEVPEFDQEDEDDEGFIDMSKYNAETWDHLVDTIDTVERTDDDKLLVYFTLSKAGRKYTGGGLRAREDSSLCKKKMAEKLCDFYENNLRWRKTEDDDGEQE